jgi:hypothetical protein
MLYCKTGLSLTHGDKGELLPDLYGRFVADDDSGQLQSKRAVLIYIHRIQWSIKMMNFQ